MPTPTEAQAREAIVRAMRALDAKGLNRGTSGNVSMRWEDGLLVTPSGVTPEALTADSIVRLSMDGTADPGALKPSSEWRMHAGLLARRPDVRAVVHCHARHATILACAGKPIPAVHYMVGVGGGSGVPIAPYEPFGSDDLARVVAETLEGRFACLMANHGLIAVAPSLGRAMAIAEEIEEQAAVYWGTLAIGGPNLLSEAQMTDILERFGTYGQKR
ncbi:class II aldolase/adducin family protein [Phenylobacterium sp.]|uniref:class II aldolase/adducin family protein n=1 Tax=Phenylobacterium sp. TaxID=1871053 RepID=UPI0012098ED7|nr:class II aldolase/adducin family protein [Phenylobacterium sp.]THD58859.1 MAG: class II aldolase [Phenylobacterium sp.]